ncbi:MAG: TetR/AcrR family transcriptional regulator [Paludibacteraceae bacterium]|nr:TetR/AcrR family transcriptional regulator [Paludibacteraceae bacterium]
METTKVLKFPKNALKICVFRRKSVFLHGFCNVGVMAIKDEIVTFASNQMEQLGIRSVSVDDLCHEFGISKKTFYVHFETKDTLLEEIMHKHEQEMAKELEYIVKKKTVLQSFMSWHAIAHQANKSTDKKTPLIHDLQKYYPDLFNKHEKNVRMTMEKFLVRFLQKGIDEKIFRQEIDVNLSAALFIDMHKSLMLRANKQDMTKDELRREGKHNMDILLRGIFTLDGLATLEKIITT